MPIRLTVEETAAVDAALDGDISDPVELMRSAGQDVATFFEFGDWQEVDFRKSEVTSVSFHGADMRGALTTADQVEIIKQSKPKYMPDGTFLEIDRLSFERGGKKRHDPRIDEYCRLIEAAESYQQILEIVHDMDAEHVEINQQIIDVVEAREDLGLRAEQMSDEGRHDDALTEHRALYSISSNERVRGKEHPTTITARVFITNDLSELGKHLEVERELLEIYKIQNESDAWRTMRVGAIVTLEALAHCYYRQGKYAAAEIHFRTVFEVYRHENSLGEKHENTLSIWSWMAETISRQKRHVESEAEFRAIHEIQRRSDVLGDDHPDALETLYSVAVMIFAQERYKEAQKDFAVIYEIRRQPDALGEQHIETIKARIPLLITCINLREWVKADKLSEGLLELMEKVFDPNSGWFAILERCLEARKAMNQDNAVIKFDILRN